MSAADERPPTSTSTAEAGSGNHRFSRTIIAPMTARAGEIRKPDLSMYKPHRCHPRLADAAHTILHLHSPLDVFARASLWVRCVRSEVGQEPGDPHLLDPADQQIRLKSESNTARRQDIIKGGGTGVDAGGGGS